MSMNVSEFVWQRLGEWGLNRVYGYPGDGVGSLDVALEKAKGKMEYVQVRHEEMATFMASAHAKFTGQVGLCYATSGPGAIHLLNGLYDAKMDHVPVVAIVGQQARGSIGASCQHEVDLQTLFKDVASDYVATGTNPNVPPLPPHVTFKDAAHFVTMMGTEPELGSVLVNSAKELLATVLPGKG